jgi:hypothetical protein
VTSPESFALQYEFFTGRPPATTLVLPEDPDEVEISGRLILFPANLGVDGATVELWPVDADTGHRIATSPEAVFNLGPDGAFGPVAVNGQRHYEFATSNPASQLSGHYYYQPFIRDDHLIRLLASPADSPILANTAVGPDHAAAVLIRYKEWWADQGAASDVVTITTSSPAWDDDPVNPSPPPQNALQNPASAPRASNKIGLHVHDAGADKVSTLDPIPFFVAQIFQTGVDVWMPATAPPDGTVSFVNAPRGDTTKLQRVNTANWASDDHRIVVQFNDYAQDVCLGRVPTIVGTLGDDVLVGTNGPDVILARAGNDTILGLGGDDVICAEEGDDTVLGGSGGDVIDGGTGDDELSGGNGNDVLDGRDGDDVVTGDNGDDVLNGGDGDDALDGGNGRDTVNGDAGDDRLDGGNGNDLLSGGPGDDTLNGDSGADTLAGGDGDDTLNGGPGGDSLDGGAGNDACDGGPQPDGAVLCEVLVNLP